jgi:hypothetical protein
MNEIVYSNELSSEASGALSILMFVICSAFECGFLGHSVYIFIWFETSNNAACNILIVWLNVVTKGP